jgi:ATP-dependent DNA helicase RecQ
LFPNVPRIALTATADEITKLEIEKRLGLEKAKKFISSFDRPNIRYSISVKQNPNKQLLDFLKLQPKSDAGIIYRLTRKNVEETAKLLINNGYKAVPYHAGMELSDREKNQRKFLIEEGVIVVATIAFGMGIDKPNVRFVVHLDLPKSLEGYYQETGRAGRDGLPAIAWMIYGLDDIKTLNYIIDKSEVNQLPKHLQKMLDEELLEIEKIKLKEDRIRYKKIEKSKLNKMLALCETSSCRRQVILRYFSEELPEACGNCDNCLSPPATWDGTDAARKALSCAYRADQRFGAHHLIDILLGRNSERMDRLGHRQLSTYGIGRDLDEKQWLSVFRQLITLGYLQVDHEAHGALKLTEAARPILRGESALLLRRDDEKRQVRRIGGTPSAQANPDNHRLWEELRQLRKELAETQGVPPYVIFQDAVLMEMMERRPANLTALGQLSGVGVRKLERYGEDFLRVINRHRRTSAPPTAMTGTATESLNLFRLGLTAEQIASRRSLKTSTVLEHLALAIRLGQLAAQEVVGLPQGDVDQISRVWDGLPDEERRGVKALYEAFEGKYDYSVLRCLHAEWVRSGTAA